MNNAEAGDISVSHESKFRRSSLVDKLISISEVNERVPDDASTSFTGWAGIIEEEPYSKTKNSVIANKLPEERSNKEKKKWRPQLYVNEILPIQLKKKSPNTVRQIDSRRAIKLGMRRLEELAAPKNTRAKIHLESYKRYEMPVKQTIPADISSSPESVKVDKSQLLHAEEEELKLLRKFMKKVPIPQIDAQFSKDYKLRRELGKIHPVTTPVHKKNMVAEVALHYGVEGPELIKKGLSEKNSNRKVVWNKSQQIIKKSNGGGAGMPRKGEQHQIYQKNHRNKQEKKEEHAQIKICSPKIQHNKIKKPDELPMPMPHALILQDKNAKSNQTNKPTKISHAIELFNWRMNPILLPNQDSVKKTKTIYYKKTLGSVTAITENTIRAGYGGSSIGKLQRKVFAGTTNKQIVPRLTGSHAEVPLLPISPDFLRKIT